MPPRGCYVLVQLLAAIAVVGSASAQDRTPEGRLVQAFGTYCIATAAEPSRVRTAIERIARFGVAIEAYPDARFETAEIVDPTGRSDLQQRMLIHFGESDAGRRRTCQVNVPWGDKDKIVAEIVGSLTLAGGTSTVVREGRYETDLTRWTTRVGSTEAVVEFGMPTYAGAAGRALTLTTEEP